MISLLVSIIMMVGNLFLQFIGVAAITCAAAAVPVVTGILAIKSMKMAVAVKTEE